MYSMLPRNGSTGFVMNAMPITPQRRPEVPPALDPASKLAQGIQAASLNLVIHHPDWTVTGHHAKLSATCASFKYGLWLGSRCKMLQPTCSVPKLTTQVLGGLCRVGPSTHSMMSWTARHRVRVPWEQDKCFGTQVSDDSSTSMTPRAQQIKNYLQTTSAYTAGQPH